MARPKGDHTTNIIRDVIETAFDLIESKSHPCKPLITMMLVKLKALANPGLKFHQFFAEPNSVSCCRSLYKR